jgi:RNase H-fold protein (predicted Holliday junction resolvase)
MHRTVLAIDPGTDKCGMAQVARDADGVITILWRGVVARDKVIATIRDKLQPKELLVVGRGTGSKPLIQELSDAMPSAAIMLVDEKDTTLQARERYWEFHPRRGWRRLLPASLQMPPEPVDDFVAFILAERVLMAS